MDEKKITESTSSKDISPLDMLVAQEILDAAHNGDMERVLNLWNIPPAEQ